MPLAIRKQGWRKVVVSPDGAVMPYAPRYVTTNADPAPLKALGRAFRWKRPLDDGTFASVSGNARAETLDRTYVGDVLRMTLLAPENVEAIAEGQQGKGVTLPKLMQGVAVKWDWSVKCPPSGRTAQPHDVLWLCRLLKTPKL